MNKKWLILSAATVLLASCASTPKVKDLSSAEILEHKGTAWGAAQPDWVSTVLTTPNQKTLSKELGISKHLWVLTKSGKTLDFLKTWVDQVDARAEIAASIKQSVADFVGARMTGEDDDVEETVERYSARAATLTISGLNKETDWWSKTRSRIDKTSDYEIKYNYLVVYSLDEKLYQKQIKDAFKDEDDEITEALLQYLLDYTVVEARD